MSQKTFNRTILISFLLLGVVYIFGTFADQKTVFMSIEVPTWVTALVVIASGFTMFKIQNFARKEARQNVKR